MNHIQEQINQSIILKNKLLNDTNILSTIDEIINEMYYVVVEGVITLSLILIGKNGTHHKISLQKKDMMLY